MEGARLVVASKPSFHGAVRKAISIGPIGNPRKRISNESVTAALDGTNRLSPPGGTCPVEQARREP